MKYGQLNKNPIIVTKKPNYIDLILYADDQAMGCAGLLLVIKDDILYLANSRNGFSALENYYIFALEAKYPELIRALGNGGKITKSRPSKVDELYNTYYLGMGNTVIIRKEYQLKNKLEIDKLIKLMSYVCLKLDEQVDITEESLKKYIPQDVYTYVSNLDELKTLFTFLKNNKFKMINKQNIDIDSLNEFTPFRICINCKDKVVGFMPSKSMDTNLLYFKFSDTDVFDIIKLTINEYEKHKNKDEGECIFSA